MKLNGPTGIWLFYALFACATSAFLPPTITEWHENKTTIEGATVTFACKANGDPKPRMKWRKDGLEITDSDILKNETIEIRRVTFEDAGLYTCRAESTLGYTEKSANLVIKRSTRITDSPVDMIVPVGKNAVFHCTATSDPSTPLTIEWLHNGEPIDFGARKRLVHQADNSLTIQHAQLPDNGTYICLAKTEEDEATAEGHLNVAERILVEVKPQEVQVVRGLSTTIHCHATSKFPLPVTVKWLHNGESIDVTPVSRFSLAADNTLTITNVRDIDFGTYSCVAKTVVDEVSADLQFTVIDVPNPPRIRSVTCSPHQVVIKWESAGDNNSPILRYHGMFSSSNNPLVWRPFAENTPATANQTTFVMTELWANYTFTIIAENAIGPSYPSSSSQTCETDGDIPHINPGGVTGKGGPNDTLVINWNIMYRHEHHGPGFKYRVYWRQDAPGFHWKAVNITDWERREYVASNEMMFQRYRIKVAAVNDLGAAKVAPTEILVYAGQDVPTESPANFIALEILNSTQALLSWDPVSLESVHGHHLGYKIQVWTNEREQGMRKFVVDNATTTTLVSNLFPYSMNYLHVLVYNDEHDGPPSKILNIHTPEGIPGIVNKFETNAMGSTALYLEWEPPQKKNGELTGYKITYAPSLMPFSTMVLVITDPYKEFTKINGLTPNTEYHLSIAATTRAGEGGVLMIYSSTRTNFTVEPDVPRFEWYQQPVVDSAARVRVVWKPFLLGNVGSHFYVMYREKGEDRFRRTLPQFTDLSIMVKGLTINKYYNFKIVVVDGSYEAESWVQEVDTSPYLRIPKFVYRFPAHKLGDHETDLSLKCVATGQQPIKIEWSVDGIPVDEDRCESLVQYITDDGDVASELNMTNMSVHEGGEYSCAVQDKVSKVTHSARVDLKGNPFIKPMRYTEANVGDDIVLTCPVTGYPLDSIIWKKDGERLFGNHQRTVYSNGTMIIRSILKSMMGAYICIVRSPNGFIATKEVYIPVSEKIV